MITVGLEGFEPATSASQTRRANQTAPQPVNKSGFQLCTLLYASVDGLGGFQELFRGGTVADGGERGQCGFVGVGEGVQVACCGLDAGVAESFFDDLKISSTCQQP